MNDDRLGTCLDFDGFANKLTVSGWEDIPVHATGSERGRGRE